MDFIYSLELTQRTLIVLNIFPFIYFGYHTKYWYRPDSLKSFDFFFSFFCILLSVVIFLKIINNRDELDVAFTEMAILHLAPLVLCVMLASLTRNVEKKRSGPAPSKEDNYENYKPVPQNREIQQLGWDQLIVDSALKEELISVMELLKDPRTATKYGIEVPQGILLSGPPGTGKTTIAKVIASTANLSFFILKMDEVASKWVGESEKNISKLFKAASRNKPAVIFIDEVDSIGRSRSGGSQWSENLLNHLLQLVDGVVKAEGLYIIAATNRADLVDPALKRGGRLNKVIEVPLPGPEARIGLFNLYLSKLHIEENLDPTILSQITDGCSAADIKEICNQAGLNAYKREAGSKKKNYVVSLLDIERALEEFVNQKRIEQQQKMLHEV